MRRRRCRYFRSRVHSLQYPGSIPFLSYHAGGDEAGCFAAGFGENPGRINNYIKVEWAMCIFLYPDGVFSLETGKSSFL